MKRLFLILFSLHTLPREITRKLLTLIIIFTFYLTGSNTLHSQWVQQTLPVNGIITDIAFLNANTGFAAIADSSWLLRTTNGGTNWSVLPNFKIGQLEKIDSLTIYGLNNYGGTKLYRSFNGGSTWDTVGIGGMCSISFITKDTGFISTLGGIYKTTNGGVSAQFLSSQTNCGIISFVKQQYNEQYYGFITESGLLFKTTNSSINWAQYSNLPNNNAENMFFLNKDTGWVGNFAGSTNDIIYTNNNGNNWIVQNLPDWNLGKIQFINSRVGWAGAGFGHIYATTNSGLNWGYQVVPTISQYNIFFLDSLIGWCGYNGLAKTTNGGGNIIYTGIEQISSEIPDNYKLFQNYPNPFNPITYFKLKVSKLAEVKVIVYDIAGKVIQILVNKKLNAGEYKVDFDGTNYSSGVYFYSLIIDENIIDTKKMILVK